VRVGNAPATTASNGTVVTDPYPAPQDATPQETALIVAGGVTLLILIAAVISALIRRRQKS